MSSATVRQVCMALIQQRQRRDTDTGSRRSETEAGAAARTQLRALLETRGPLRTADGRVIRLKAQSSRRSPHEGLIRDAVGAANHDLVVDRSSPLLDSEGVDAPWRRVADSVFVQLKQLMFPRTMTMSIGTSCPRGSNRDDLPQLEPRFHGTLAAYERSNKSSTAARKRTAVEMQDMPSDEALLARLHQAGGAIKYSLTVDGVRRSATLAEEPTTSCELLVSDMAAIVTEAVEEVLADVREEDIEAVWVRGDAREQVIAHVMRRAKERKQEKRRSATMRVRLRAFK